MQHGLASVGETGESAQRGSANVVKYGESAQHGLTNVGESQHQQETRQNCVRE
jgi:hypothetical protein